MRADHSTAGRRDPEIVATTSIRRDGGDGGVRVSSWSSGVARGRGRAGRARVWGGLGLVAVVAGLLPACAWGAQAHEYANLRFGLQGHEAGEMELEGSGLAVNDETGDVYVADTGNDRVDQFEADGTFVRAWGWGVADGSTAALQECTVTCFKGLAGSGAGEFQAPVFIGVDNSCALHTSGLEDESDPLTGSACETYDPSNGDVYVGEAPSASVPVVTKFTVAGALVSFWGDNGPLNGKHEATPNGQLAGKNETEGGNTPGGPFLQLQGIAVDTTGNLFVWSSGTSVRTLFGFTQAGGVKSSSEPEKILHSPVGIAVNSQDETYIGEGTQMGKLNPAGELLGIVAEGTEIKGTGGNTSSREFAGSAVDPTHGFLYLDEAHEGNSVRVFSPQCVPSNQQANQPLPICQPTEVFGNGVSEPFGPGPVLAGIAVNSSTGRVYVADHDETVAFAATLETVVDAATGVGYGSATVNGEVSPEGGQITSCSFQYGETETYGQSVPCLSSEPGHEHEQVGTPENPITTPLEVHADLTGLNSDAVYHARTHIARAGSGTEGNLLYSEDTQLKTLTAAVVAQANAEPDETSATLKANINPMGLETTYRFEYDTSSYRRGEAPHGTPIPAPDATIGKGGSPVAVSQAITGLTPGQTYYFRVIATDHCNTEKPAEICINETPVHTFIYLTKESGSPCSNEAVRKENGSLALPDCRAVEMITPANKNGALFGDVFGHPETGVSLDGSRVTSVAIQCPEAVVSCIGDRDTQGSPFVFERGESGWSSTALLPSAQELYAVSRWGTFPESGEGVFVGVATPDTPEDMFVGRPGAYVEVGPVEEHPEPHSVNGVVGVTPDESHILYDSALPAWGFDATDPTANNRLYEYVGSGHTEPIMVGVMGGQGSHELISKCGTSAGQDGEGGRLSSDGTQAFFIAEGSPGCFGAGPANEHVEAPVDELFDRVEGEGAGAHTVAISKPSPSECGTGSAPDEKACRKAEEHEPGDAEFQGASEDGSMAYFTDTQQLTNEASEDNTSGDNAKQTDCSSTRGRGGCNLYLYDFRLPAGRRLVDVSEGDSSGAGPEVRGVMAVSADGSHVYFVARGVLSEAANMEGQRAREGGENLYVYERDGTHPEGRVVFIATVSGDTAQWAKGPRSYEANVTPEGGFLVFEAANDLTGDASGSGAQLYRYDAESEVLARVSIGDRGYNDNGNAGGDSATAQHQSGRPPTASVRGNMSMSNDGSQVFFASTALLAPGASSEGVNIYEWKEDGAGEGKCMVLEGCVALIAAGAVELLGVDGSGDNVFFSTNLPLVPADVDSEVDFYDARVGGGFPQPREAVSCGVSVVCHPGLVVGSEGVGGSLSLLGSGNPLFTPPLGGSRESVAEVRARKLRVALRVCRRDRGRARRLSCERMARKRFGPVRRATKARRGAGVGGRRGVGRRGRAGGARHAGRGGRVGS